jgi:uncharacterized protein YceH (UPF0502 family)
MIQLIPDEARVLGVLIEKAMTTPDLYPLTLNAITAGSNQKNNRDPVRTMTADECFEAAESLRAKTLAVRVDQMGSRTQKYRHTAADVLRARPGELAVLAELLLRGPQTVGELRTRASRMSPMESLEVTQGLLVALMSREVPLAREIPPAPGSRAVRYQQLLAPEAAVEAAAAPLETGPGPATSLGDRVSALEKEVAGLKQELGELREALGEPKSSSVMPQTE